MSAEFEYAKPTPLMIQTSGEGVIQAEAHVPEGATAVVVLSHPHPMFGGDMYNPLIDHLFATLPTSGPGPAIGVVRYNFRGVGRSTGEFADGIGEREDTEAVFEFAAGLGTGPVVSAGWSFGADVSLSANHEALAGWLAIAAPLAIVQPSDMIAAADARPKLLLVPEFDQYRKPQAAAEIIVDWPNTEMTTIEGADHFLGTQAPIVAAAAAQFVASV